MVNAGGKLRMRVLKYVIGGDLLILMRKVLFIFFGFLGGILLSEAAFRFVLQPPRLFWGPDSWKENEYDREFGWIPRLGNKFRDPRGFLIRESRVDGQGPVIAVIGDSVVAQNHITNRLQERLTRKFNLANLGVPGYNTYQAVGFFEKYALSLNPRLVLLLLHPNDFQHSVVGIAGKNNLLTIVNSNGDRLPANRWLFENSVFYQLFNQLFLATAAGRLSESEIIYEPIKYLFKLSEDRGFEVLLVILPIFKPSSAWTTEDKTRRDKSLMYAKRVGIEFVDCYPILLEAEKMKITIKAHPEDHLHPSIGFARLIADRIFEKNITHRLDRLAN